MLDTAERLTGVYRGIVADRNDPEGLLRVRVRVTSLLGDQETDWAWPSVPALGGAQAPNVGDPIWIIFEEGDIDRPVYLGTWAPNQTPVAPVSTTPYIISGGTNVYAVTTAIAFATEITGDTSPRMTMTGDGTLRWGSGHAATDTAFGRTGAATLGLTGSLTVSSAVNAASLYASGALTAASAAISGSLSAGATTLTGSLSGTSATFSSTLSAASLSLGSPLPISSGGTGSATQNFVDLTTAQNIAGVKTFASAPVVPINSFPESAVTNLVTDLAARALDSTVVHLAGTETITGAKTFLAAMLASSVTAGDGTVVQQDIFSMESSGYGDQENRITRYSDTWWSKAFWVFQHARGTKTAPTNVVAGDAIGGIRHRAYYAGQWVGVGDAAMYLDATIGTYPAGRYQVNVQDTLGNSAATIYAYGGIGSGSAVSGTGRVALVSSGPAYTRLTWGGGYDGALSWSLGYLSANAYRVAANSWSIDTEGVANGAMVMLFGRDGSLNFTPIPSTGATTRTGVSDATINNPAGGWSPTGIWYAKYQPGANHEANRVDAQAQFYGRGFAYASDGAAHQGGVTAGLSIAVGRGNPAAALNQGGSGDILQLWNGNTLRASFPSTGGVNAITTGGHNLVQNSWFDHYAANAGTGFDTGFWNWYTYNWYPGAADGAISPSRVGDALHGTYSLRLQWTTNTGNKGIRQGALVGPNSSLTWLANKTYIIGMWIKHNANAAAPSLAADVGGFTDYLIENPTPQNNVWQRYIWRRVIGGADVGTNLYPKFTHANGDVYIDSVWAQEGDTPAPWQPGLQDIYPQWTLDSYFASLRGGFNVTGGGSVKWDGQNISWDTRLIIISNNHNDDFSTAGYFDISMPASGTVITGVGGHGNVTVVAGGIPLGGWDALYYILPIGSNNASQAGNFRIATYSGAGTFPANWFLVAVRNSDAGGYTKFCTGVNFALANSNWQAASNAYTPISGGREVWTSVASPAQSVGITIPTGAWYTNSGWQVTVNKRLANTALLVRISISCWANAATQFFVGAGWSTSSSFTSPDFSNSNVFFFNQSGVHQCWTMVKRITGMAAGTYYFRAGLIPSSNTLGQDNADSMSIVVEEVV